MYIFFSITLKSSTCPLNVKSLDTGMKTSTCMGSVSWRVTVFRQAAVSLLTHDVNPLTHAVACHRSLVSGDNSQTVTAPGSRALSAWAFLSRLRGRGREHVLRPLRRLLQQLQLLVHLVLWGAELTIRGAINHMLIFMLFSVWLFGKL